MPFQAACPFCPTKINRVPEHALGISIRCPQCGNHFTVAPADDVPVSTPGRLESSLSLAVKQTNVQPAPAPSTIIQKIEIVQENPPLTDHGVAQGYSRPAGNRFISRFVGWVALGGAACVAALLVTLSGSRGPSQQKQVELLLDDPDPHRFLLVTPDNRQIIRDLGRSEWANAETEGLRQGRVHIRILGSKIGAPAATKSAKAGSTPVSLLIQVQLTNSVPGSQRVGLWSESTAPILSNAKGVKYALRKLPPDAGVGNKSERAVSSPSDQVQQVLAFEPPAADVDELKLELPASVWGGEGICRFRIPRTMIGVAERTKGRTSP